MQLTLTVRHGEAPDSLKSYVQDEVLGLTKYFERLVEGDIILDQEGHRHIAEIRIHTSNDTHFASAETDDWRTAVDATVDKLRRQLKRHKEKLIRRSLTHEERERLAVARREKQPAETLSETDGRLAAPPEWDRITSSEAVDRLARSDEEVLVFVDPGDGAVRIARRDHDGAVSVVTAETYEVEEG